MGAPKAHLRVYFPLVEMVVGGGRRCVMWWTMPEAGAGAGEQEGEKAPVRRLAVAGSLQRRQRTVLTLVRLRDVHPNPDQPRKHFDDEKLGEVAALLGKSRPYVSNILAITRLPDAVKADLERDGGAVSRELLMGVARQEDPLAALALWRRLQLGVLSVRRFREEKAGRRRERAAVAEVLALARRMNRALARLLADELPANETPRVSRAL